MQVIPGIGTIWLLVKIFFIIGLLVYLVFALVVVRQVQIMSDTVKFDFQLPVKVIALLHLLFALGILIFAIITL